MDDDLAKITYLLRVSELEGKVNYRTIAKLVYSIDPCLYKDFFGSVENAVTYIEKALDTDFSIFNKHYLHLLVQDGKIIGTAVIYSKNAEYFENDEMNLIKKHHLELSNTFGHVSEYYKNFINNNKGVYKLASICVDEKYRGNGYGKLLMKRIDEATNGDTKYLTVLRENGRAINNYSKTGYSIVREFWDYFGVPADNKVEMAHCYSMVKSAKTPVKSIIEVKDINNNNLKNKIITKQEYFENMSKNKKHFVIAGDFDAQAIK